MEAVEAAWHGHQHGALGLEHLPDRLVGYFLMFVGFGISHAFVEQKPVQLFQAFHPQGGREEPLAHQPDLVLHLAFFPAGRGRAGCRFNKIMAAHLCKPTVVAALLAHKDRINRRFHIVIDAARAGTPEEGKRPVVGIKHHLLRFSRIGADKKHPAMAQPNMRYFHRDRRVVDAHNLVAPVELVGLTRRKNQRHIGLCRHRAAFFCPAIGIAPHGVIAAFKSSTAQFLKNPDQCQPFPGGLALIGSQQGVKFRPERVNLWLGLRLAFVAELCGVRAHDLAHYLA